MTTLRLYKTYSFKNKNPVIDELRTAIKDEGIGYKEIHDRSNVSVACMRGWFHGATRRPQHDTLQAVAISIGYEFKLVKRKEKR